MANPQPEQSSPAAGPAQAGSHVSATRLVYMADLLQELRDMAAAEGHATLCGLIAMAEAEARRRGKL